MGNWTKADDEKYKKDVFLMSRSPLAWAYPAIRHMRAADILFDIACKASNRMCERFAKASAEGTLEYGQREMQGEDREDYQDSELLDEYYLLVGYSLEC